MSGPAMLTVAETAERLAVSPDTVRRWIGAGILDVFQVGRVVRVPEASVLELIQARTTPARGTPRRRPQRPPARPRKPAVSRPAGSTPMGVLARMRSEEGGSG